ncbi:MAG: HNH endonuclease [Patescibacteria group bacterium]
MSNNYSIPNWLEEKVRSRDKFCVYCHTELKEYLHTKGTPSDKATFEHIDNDGPPSEENIAMCCASCNASKGVKKILDWFDSPFCKEKHIGKETVADVIRKYIETSK